MREERAPPDNRARRESFDRVAASYTAARPSYPEQLVSDLVQLAGIGPDSTVLEIGPGTGQLTVPLAETGAAIVAVELGQDLATIARDRLSGYGNVEVVIADFDSWTISATFDVVVAATSFHWLDPLTRVVKCRSAMKPDGALAVIETRWGVWIGLDDPFFDRSQGCYSQWDPAHDPSFWHPSPADVETMRGELEESGLFGEVQQRRYVAKRTYSRAQFLQLINTYSTVQSWPQVQRDGFLQCMAKLIDEEFGGDVERFDLYDLCIATRDDRAPSAASPRRSRSDR